MGSVQQLTVDLTNLSVESKRRYGDIKQGCDRALSDLKVYQAVKQIQDITNEVHKKDIITPFIASCKTGNAKITTISIPIIHRLIMGGIVPVDVLNELVDALVEASHLGVDIQLRILQCLPTLMQTYNWEFTGKLLIKLLSLCSSLTTNNKSTVVINTASATLQQLFSNVYDKYKESEETEKSVEIKIDNDSTVKVDAVAFEGFNIFSDLCHIIENEKVTYFDDSINMKVTSVLEIIENLITGHRDVFHSHQELAYLLRVRVIPSLLRVLHSPHKSFPLVTRTMRILHVLMATQLTNLEIESEIVLSFLNHILLNNDAGSDIDHWEKILVLEMFKSLFNDFNVLKSIYELYDNNDRKKNVIHELISILSTYLSYNSYLTNDIVKPLPKLPTGAGSASTQQGPYPIYLSKTSSNMKTPVLDHLDKTEPPYVIPQTYPVYLIFNILLAYTDGIAEFVQSLSNNSDPSNLEADVDFTNAFIESTFSEISSLFDQFIYMSMDDESFHFLIRSLQRFTHTSGLLGLGKLRDRLLIILSTAITRNETSADSIAPSPNPNTFQEQGKQLLAFGESIVESFSSTIQPQNQGDVSTNGSTPQLLRSRYFNSRHVTCLRALANLAVSLGSTLQGSWRIIWITFQWCDYFIDGPDEYSGYQNSKFKHFSESMLPQLSASDINNFDLSRKKIFDSLNEYQIESFQHLLEALIGLSDSSFNSDDGRVLQEFDEKKPDDELIDDDLVVCPYNKTYYLTKLVKIAQLDSKLHFIQSDRSWDLLCNYFVNLGARRDLGYNLRMFIIANFNRVINSIADQGFKSEKEDIIHKTSDKSLEGLSKFLDGVFKLGLPQELLVLNCETEIHLAALTTLHELIDKYDTYYQHSWQAVFTILNTPFKTVGADNEDGNLSEKIRLLIEKSFDTLKLILDEFVSSLPYSQLKLLIDTLFNFCSQKYDLNISFSSVSYFWLISDSVKSRISKVPEIEVDALNEVLGKIQVESDLITYIETHNSDETYLFYILVDTYLLSSLVKLSFDTRAQVRDGSIQTFFQIMDVHGSLLTASKSWNLVYTIVLPNLLNIKLDYKESTFNTKEWLESLNLILSGLVSIYDKFMMGFNDIPFAIQKWETLIDYFKGLLELKWIELNLKIFKSFKDLLIPFSKSNREQIIEFDRIRELLFNFWTRIPVEYDFINPSYQQSITALMDCFPALFPLIANKFSLDEVNAVLNLLNKCARYPILPDAHLDIARPSKLQKSVVTNLKIIEVADPKIQSQIIQQLSSIVTYPFGTRSTIESKLGSNSLITNKFKIPTFIAVSHLSLKLLKEKLDKLGDLTILVEDRGIEKVLKSLLEIIRSRSIGIENEEKAIWVEANEAFRSIVSKLVELPSVGNDIEICKLMIDGVKTCLEKGNEQKYEHETINIKQYHDLTTIIFPSLLANPENELLIDEFVENIYTNSYLYEFDELELSFIEETKGSTDELIELFSSFDFNASFGSTQRLVKYANKSTRFNCLQELIKFCHEPDNQQLNVSSQKFFACRSSLSLRRFISDERLLFKCPISKIQEQEIIIILQGLSGMEVKPENKANYRKLYPLVIKLVPFASRIKGLDELIEKVLHRF